MQSHLEKVVALAADYGKPIGIENMARLAGILHDFGKYSALFPKVLTKEASRVDHAGPGAALLRNIRPSTKFSTCIEAINGHHGGLVSRAKIGVLEELPTGDAGEIYTNFDKQCSLPNGEGETIATQAQVFFQDIPDFAQNYLMRVKQSIYDGSNSDVIKMLMTRKLYSCLVDADYSASAEVDDAAYLDRASGGTLDAKAAERKRRYYCNRICQ